MMTFLPDLEQLRMVLTMMLQNPKDPLEVMVLMQNQRMIRRIRQQIIMKATFLMPTQMNI